MKKRKKPVVRDAEWWSNHVTSTSGALSVEDIRRAIEFCDTQPEWNFYSIEVAFSHCTRWTDGPISPEEELENAESLERQAATIPWGVDEMRWSEYNRKFNDLLRKKP